jgi:hypothetical protein
MDRLGGQEKSELLSWWFEGGSVVVELSAFWDHPAIRFAFTRDNLLSIYRGTSEEDRVFYPEVYEMFMSLLFVQREDYVDTEVCR